MRNIGRTERRVGHQWRGRLLAYSTFILILLVGCSEGPSGPAEPDLRLSVSSGDNQFALPGGMLHDPLKVTVTNVATQRPMPGIAVAWSIVEGSGGVLSAYATTTDDNGASEVYLTLGSAVGLFRAQASVDGQVGGPVEFEARAVLPPSLTSVPDYPVSAGDTIAIGGENLNQLPGEHVVLFSGVRGRVVSIGATELRVRVPPCLPDRSVDVWLALGSVTSEPRPLQVLEGSQYLELEPGEDLLLYDPDAYSCVRLPSGAESWYLALIHSASTSPGSRHEYHFTGLMAQAPQAMAHRLPGPTPPMVEVVDSREVHPTLANRGFELPGGGANGSELSRGVCWPRGRRQSCLPRFHRRPRNRSLVRFHRLATHASSPF